MQNKTLLISGKAKDVYDNGRNSIIMEYTNRITAFNNKRKDILKDKGKINCEITNLIFNFLAKNKIKTHFLKKISPTEIECEKLTMIPLEVILRNYAKGSLVKRFGIKEYTKFDEPIVEFSLKNDKLNDPLISERQIIAMKILDKKILETIIKTSLKINQLLSNLFSQAKINLLDFKIEFGFNQKNKVILGDEISPDCMRLENFNTREKYDKDIYRNQTGDVIEGYRKFLEVLKNVL